jgi:hypothetical protein
MKFMDTVSLDYLKHFLSEWNFKYKKPREDLLTWCILFVATLEQEGIRANHVVPVVYTIQNDSGLSFMFYKNRHENTAIIDFKGSPDNKYHWLCTNVRGEEKTKSRLLNGESFYEVISFIKGFYELDKLHPKIADSLCSEKP